MSFYSVNYFYLATGMEGRPDEKWYGYYEAESALKAIEKCLDAKAYKANRSFLRSCLTVTEVSIDEMARGLK